MRNELDDAIVQLLVQSTRATHRCIAESTGAAESTVRARVQGLIESGAVVPSILVHPDIEVDGFIYLARLRLAEGVGASTIAEDVLVATSPWIAQVATDGELLVQLSATGFEDMLHGLDSIRSLPGVSRLHSVLVLRLFVGASWAADPARTGDWAAKPTRSVDATDRALMSALRLDGRASYTALASVVNLTVAATRRRVLRLVEDGVMRFATRVLDDAPRSREAVVDLAVDSAGLPGLIGDLCALSSVRYVIEQTGEHNLACHVDAPDTAELARAVAGILADPRVLNSRTDPLIVLRDRVSWIGSSF